MKPTQVIVGSIPSFSFANRAIDHFNELKGLKESREVEANGGRQISELEEVNFNKLVFQYEYEKDNFKIGPIDLILTKGQIVFLSGGNGSGKSTFIKLLTGLYSPKSGDVMVNNEKISNIQSDYYRSLFSVIYTDSYLFDVVLGFEGNQDEKMNGILAKLGISSKVKCKDNILSTIDLSYGQRKRVNLAICLLEDKPIYIFDEVAANQDSKFKAYFYTNVLQELKEKGKIVFVVTHDDKYFHLADQHFKMDEGKIHSYNITNNR